MPTASCPGDRGLVVYSLYTPIAPVLKSFLLRFKVDSMSIAVQDSLNEILVVISRGHHRHESKLYW